MTFGEKIRWLRKRRNLSQRKLSRLLGIHRNTINSWENYDIRPTSNMVYTILAEYFQLPVGYFKSELPLHSYIMAELKNLTVQIASLEIILKTEKKADDDYEHFIH
jgi:transcriptional regulator with XRE-family HTH domain